MTTILEVRDLVKEYPGVKALRGVDLDVREAEVHCLLGPNGAGKSTLIKCVSGAVEPTSGEIRFQGEPLPAGDPAGSLKRGVATIYQELDLVEDLSVAESVFLAHEPRRGPLLDLDKMYRDSAALLARLGHESIPPRAKVGALRPAAQQIVSIARALSGDVRLLIMDEPSAILDGSEIETLFDVVRRLTAEGVGVVYISHRLDEIRRIGDRVTVLADGATAANGLPATTPTDELVELMVGRKVDQLYPDRPGGHRQAPARGQGRQAAAGGARRQPARARGRGGRARRARGLGPHGAPAPDLRPRPAGGGRGVRRGRAAAAEPSRPRDQEGAGAGAGGPQVAGAGAGLEPDQERDARRPAPLLAAAC